MRIREFFVIGGILLGGSFAAAAILTAGCHFVIAPLIVGADPVARAVFCK